MSHGQSDTTRSGRVDVAITKEKRPDRIYAQVIITSNFFGGDSSWIRSIENNLNRAIPSKNGAKAGTYTVSVAFIANKEGSLSDFKLLNDPGFGMGDEVLRTIKKSPKWIPGPVRPYRH